MTTYFDIIMIPLQLLIVFFTIYYFTLSFFGLVYRKKDKKVYEEKHTFAMVVCAHNEERVIGALVENLHLLNYSDKLYDIFVVADNCTDKTAEVPVHRCMSVLMTPKRAKAMPWTGCSTACSKWNASMTPCAFLTPITLYTLTF